MQPIIEVNNLGKCYNIGEKQRYLALRDTLTNVIKSPLAWFGSKMNGSNPENEFWALNDLNFTVEQGEVLGIIGRNGAGKSTLLKILSQITPPTTGEIRLHGRVGSLLEVGTGFHPELSGRENIFLNGAILGMRKKEIEKKFDEIVDFAGVEKFLDLPVKRYSSGMYVRLAFAVAAHLKPDILIIDEVLAVGDAEFQKKCLAKMKDVTTKDGRTVLFVSHNIGAIQQLCTRAILLDQGLLVNQGEVNKVIESYQEDYSSGIRNFSKASLQNRLMRTDGRMTFHQASPIKNGKECWNFFTDEVTLFEFHIQTNNQTDNMLFYLCIKNPSTGELISTIKEILFESSISEGKQLFIRLCIPKNTFRPGQYAISFAIGDREAKSFYDVLDENVSLPLLRMDSVDTDVYANIGLLNIPYTLELV